jgi:hypothetical protein
MKNKERKKKNIFHHQYFAIKISYNVHIVHSSQLTQEEIKKVGQQIIENI